MDDLIGFIVLVCIAALVLPILLAAATAVIIVAAVVLAVLGICAAVALREERKAENSNPKPGGS